MFFYNSIIYYDVSFRKLITLLILYYHILILLLSFGRGAPKSTTQGVILTTLPLATFQLLKSTSIDEYRWREHVILRLMTYALL